MASITANGQPVLVATIFEPRRGVWHADLELDATDPLSGAVTLDFGVGVSAFQGTVRRAGVYGGRAMARIVGGKDGLSKILKAKFYRSSFVRVALGELLADAGEALDASVLPSAIEKALTFWHRAGVTDASAGQALERLAQEASMTWRVLRNGNVWFGVETWPESKAAFDLLDSSPADGERVIALDSGLPEVLPGVTLAGERVEYVVTRLTGESFRQELVVQ